MEAPAQLEGCVVLSVSDADLFAESSDAKEAFRKTLAQAAGDGVEPEYVQDLTVSVGQSCDARRLAQHGVLIFSSDTDGRRLQEAVTVNFVIVFPAALGTEVAIQVAEISRQILETITVEEVTTILQEEVQTIPVLQNVSVSVTNKNVQEVQITVTSTADTAAADVNTLAVMSGLLAILFPVSMFGIWWRCQKRLRPDSHIPGDHAPKPKPREDEDEPRSDESDDSESAQSFFTAVGPSEMPPKRKKKLRPKAKARRRRRSVDEDGQAVKHKKKLRPKKALELESINVIEAKASPRLIPSQLLSPAPARSFLEDEGVLFDIRPPMMSRGSLFSEAGLPEEARAARAELEDVGVLFDRPPKQVQVVESEPACIWSDSSDDNETISRP